MSPIEHYFENLIFHGSDIKGEPNKNALSKEVQEAIEECAVYVKYNLHYGENEEKMGLTQNTLYDKIDKIENSNYILSMLLKEIRDGKLTDVSQVAEWCIDKIKIGENLKYLLTKSSTDDIIK